MVNVSLSGAVSGLDTASLITSLVQAQNNQQALLKTQQKAQQTAADTMGKISTALTAAGGLAGTLAKTSTWVGTTATSSSTSVTAAAVATATGSATGSTGGSLTFDVARLAAGHALVSSGTVSSTSAVVAGSGTLTLTTGTGTTDIAVGGGTLTEVVTAINGAGKGVTAAAVQTSPGQYRLQLTATTSGAASEFAVTGLDGFAGLDVLTQASDAALRIGGNPDTAYEIVSPTNTFTGVLLGVALTVSKVETGVTVQRKVDGSAVADQVAKLVDAVNGVLSQIGTATSYNATTRSGGPLMGDATVRAVQQQLLETISSAGAAGVRLTRDGKATFDREAFLTAFAADPAKVKAAFGAGATFAPGAGISGSIALSSSTTATAPGTYAVEVTQRAAREQWSLPAASFGQGSTVTLTRGSTTVSFTVPAEAGATEVAAGLSRQATAAGFGVGAAADAGGDLVLTADASGSAGAFTLTVDGAPAGTQTTAGADTAGTIDGQAATGVGDLLTLPKGTGGAVGLALDTSGLAASDIGGAVGSVTYTPGLASALSRMVDGYTATNTGALSAAAKGRQSSVTTLQGQIEDWDRRLAAYRSLLTRQFTAMETAIATLKSQTSSISALVNASTASSSSSS